MTISEQDTDRRQRVLEAIRHYFAGQKSQVEKVVDELNQRVRDAVADQCRFTIHRSIRVEVSDGLPGILEDWLRKYVVEHLDCDRHQAFPQNVLAHFVRDTPKLLVLDPNGEDQDQGRCVDMLGCYWPAKVCLIELFWIPICLVAPTIDVTVDALSAVVLAHEWAHAYTDVGEAADDIPGRIPDDRNLTEGLAQYWTHYATLSMRAKDSTDCYRAFVKLLNRQNGPYWAHAMWLTWADWERFGVDMQTTALGYHLGDALLSSYALSLRENIRFRLLRFRWEKLKTYGEFNQGWNPQEQMFSKGIDDIL